MRYDIGIVGGGPAGATSAFFLCKAGFSVILFEKEIFPRPHVGESLLPFCYDLFEEMGIVEKLNKRFARKPGVLFASADGQRSASFCFNHVIKGDKALSYHVVRADFDKLLLDTAIEAGAKVMQGTTVTDVSFRDDPGEVELKVRSQKDEQKYQVGFLLDASGQDTFLGRKLRLKRPHPDLDRVSFTNHWHGIRMIKGLEAGIIQIVYTGAGKDGWMSLVPLAEDRLSISLVLNNKYVREQKKQFPAGTGDWIEQLYRRELNGSQHVREVIDGASLLQDMMVVGNYSYRNEQKFNGQYAMIGDAGEFLDPIFATGVYLAMKSGSLISRQIADKGLNDRARLMAGLEETYKQIAGAYQLVYKFIHIFYAPDGYDFTTGKDGLNADFDQKERAFKMQHFLLAGDFFTNYERYLGFLELLENPRRYEQYDQLVMNRTIGEETSCGFDPKEIFGAIKMEAFIAEKQA